MEPKMPTAEEIKAQQEIDDAGELELADRFERDHDKENEFDFEELSDFESEEFAEKIMLYGPPDKLEELRLFHGLSKEKMKMFSQFTKLRHDTIEQKNKEFGERILTNPDPTDEELKMGAYKEEIEYQVRDAIIELRKKGYNTFESGFYGPEKQRIGFDEKYFDNFVPSENLKRMAEDKGLSIDVFPDAIELSYKKFVEIEDIKYIWDKVVEELDDLGQETKTASTGMARDFLERVESIKANPKQFLHT